MKIFAWRCCMVSVHTSLTQLVGFDCWRFRLILDHLVLRSSSWSCCHSNSSVSLNLLGSSLFHVNRNRLHLLFFLSTFFFFFTHNTTQHSKYNKTKQQTHTQHLKVQSKGRERGKDNKNTKVTPLYNHVYQKENTAKHQWSKAWPHQLALLYIHTSLFAGGYGSNMFFHTCVV